MVNDREDRRPLVGIVDHDDVHRSVQDRGDLVACGLDTGIAIRSTASLDRATRSDRSPSLALTQTTPAIIAKIQRANVQNAQKGHPCGEHSSMEA